MSKEIIDMESELNEMIFIAGTCGVGKTHWVREYGSEMVKECEVFDKDCVLHEIYQRGQNRCFVQRKLYEIYYKPDGVSYKKSGLFRLEEDRPFVESWILQDHNEAIRLLKICQDNMEEFKASLPTMRFHNPIYYTRNSTVESIRKQYKRLIDYYEATGFLEELTTCI